LVNLISFKRASLDVLLEACRLITILCRFDDFREKTSGPAVVSSSNDTVLELSRCGLIQVLKEWLLEADIAKNSKEETCSSSLLLPAIWTTIRVLAVHDRTVQSIVACGILESALETFTTTTPEDNVELLASLVGLFRNLSANDEIKTTLCFSDVLSSLLKYCRNYIEHTQLQEHSCGFFAAMALRKPKNATRILQYGGVEVIVTAMTQHPTITLIQRQGCLALRNIASRISSERRQIMLDQDAKRVLVQAGVCSAGCIDEAYAALRDLGCEPTKTTVHADGTVSSRPQMFGEIKPNFRPVYD